MTMPDTAPRSLALIHTVAGLVPVFADLTQRHLPGWEPFNIVDESLLRNTIRTGELSRLTMRRLAGYVWSAVDAGAEAILVTCSSLGPAVDAAIPLCPVPLFRIDDGMALAALEKGTRIGVLATLSTTLAPTADLLKHHAAQTGTRVSLTSRVCEGAFARLAAGDRAGHDALVRTELAAIAPKVDVVVLAQASMARALEGQGDAGFSIPILTSPELGVQHVKQALARI
ncbi:aspartate/glutamate racemase family protein [Xanthobacter sp. DSM 24535]|uniref:aspartate/glutamate racemase family protein n=1 Tax=Roseixanthobacter psychrophilus TaxID=3119917 RepID=UPI0037273E6A